MDEKPTDPTMDDVPVRQDEPSNFPIQFRGFGDQQSAEKIAGVVSGIVGSMKRIIPLDRLDGFTFAADYAGALLELNRGFEASAPPTPTVEAFGLGVGMAVTVARDGLPKKHVVFASWIAEALAGDDEIAKRYALYIIVHELAHVAEFGIFDEAFPDVLLKPHATPFMNYFWPRANPTWDEYFACRMSAGIDAGLFDGYRDTLISVLEQGDEAIKTGLNSFRETGAYEQAANTVLDSLSSIMKYSGYLLGHADGLEEPPTVVEGELEAKLEAMGLTEWFTTLHQHNRHLFETSAGWKSLDEFDVLTASLIKGAALFGVHCHRSEDPDEAFYVQIFA
ncbi:hypothetical protein PY365_27125 [Roseiarcaceae bacterium H3SJ34-1]|uniref:hypothetical protein n=1 Tax=Terripilifer ovatus TaxID=3032367 RepID=UPI003AB92D5A|nr:hypothetical protein [Roseiarcaceae bacterium H3SJ34-1]